jgi:hypothetical protein
LSALVFLFFSFCGSNVFTFHLKHKFSAVLSYNTVLYSNLGWRDILWL